MNLHLKDDDLLRWRDKIADYGTRAGRLDRDGVKTIFETHAVPDTTARDLRADLRFQWNIEEEVALKRLDGVIYMLVAEQEIDERMAELNAKMIADHSLDSYDAVETERRGLRAQRAVLLEMGYELGSDEPQQDVDN